MPRTLASIAASIDSLIAIIESILTVEGCPNEWKAEKVGIASSYLNFIVTLSAYKDPILIKVEERSIYIS